MEGAETVHAEPRDTTNAPFYRVNLWQPNPVGGWSLEAYVLTDAQDVTEVLQWVDEHARGRRVEVFAEMQEEQVQAFSTPRTAGLVRLLGSNPNRSDYVSLGPFEKI